LLLELGKRPDVIPIVADVSDDVPNEWEKEGIVRLVVGRDSVAMERNVVDAGSELAGDEIRAKLTVLGKAPHRLGEHRRTTDGEAPINSLHRMDERVVNAVVDLRWHAVRLVEALKNPVVDLVSVAFEQMSRKGSDEVTPVLPIVDPPLFVAKC